MALLSRSARIIILLVLTTLFFFLELIVGYMAGSIALIADSFHMLSDILSLCVALYAIRLAKRTNYGPRYSYGWQRAEVLGALINGVFLLALCLTIVIEAIQRFVSPQPIERPQLVLGVGTAGLIVNLLGMGLFHEHGHGHGHSHSHGHDHGHEHGHSHSHGHRHGHSITSIVEDEEKAAQGGSAAAHTTAISSGTRGSSGSRQAASDVYIRQQQDDDDDEDEEYMEGHSGRQRAQTAHRNIVSGSKQLARSPEEDIAILPAQTRASMVQLATATRQKQEAMERQVSDSDSSHQDIQSAEPLSPTTAEEDTEEDEVVISMDGAHVSADTVCCPTADLATDGRTANSAPSSACDVQHGTTQRKQQKKAQKAKTGALNMQGVFLHVLGDALGSVAVIISALIIWLTDWPYRYYVDPIISLLITAMIVAFTVPLVRSTCYILLQGAPLSVPVEEVRTDILALPGVASVHELHIWQLSDTKLIASVHVLVSSDHDYMRVARRIKRLLHGYGIHSTTVQPERMPELDDNGQPILQSLQAHPRDSLVPNEQDRSEVSCLLRCADADCMPAMCCPPTESTATDTETARTRQSPHQH